MGTMFNYEGDVYLDIDFEVEVKDADGNILECEADCDGHDKQILITLDPRYKLNQEEDTLLEDFTVADENHFVYSTAATVNIEDKTIHIDSNNLKRVLPTTAVYAEIKEELKADLRKELIADEPQLIHHNFRNIFLMCRIEDEQKQPYVQGVDITLKKDGDDNVLVIPKEAIDRLKADLRKEVVEEITAKLFG